MLAEDETHLNLLAWVGATWVPHGTRQQLMTPGTNRRRSVFGAVDLASGRFLSQITRKAASATFIGFMEHVLAGYPNAALVMLMLDDVTIHRSKKVQAWLRTQPGCGWSGGLATARTTTPSNGSGVG